VKLKTSGWRLAALLWLGSSLVVQGQRTSGDSPTMAMDIDLIHAGKMCLMLGGDGKSDSFLRNLNVRERHGKRTFREGSTDVKSFPAWVTVTVRGALNECEPREEGRSRNDLLLDPSFMSTLRFEAYWKNGFDLRKTDVTIAHKGQSPDLAEVSPTTDLWKYELSVRSENVPLSDALVIVVIERGGGAVSRLSGKL